MPKNKNKGHRETWSPRQELPAVPDLGNLSMPRKGNREAAKYVATVGNLWDRRRADRKARKLTLARQDAVSANPRRQHLDKAVREQMLSTMSAWSFDHKVKAFVPKAGGPVVVSAAERVEELLDAITDLRPRPGVLRVSGLSLFEAARVRGYLGTSSTLVVMNPRYDTPADRTRLINFP